MNTAAATIAAPAPAVQLSPVAVALLVANKTRPFREPSPVQDALTRLLLRARLTVEEWEELRPYARVGLRHTRFGPPYRYVAVSFPDGSYYNIVEGPSDAPGAVAWWSRRLGVPAE